MISMTHYRHGTSIIELEGKRILLDPVFAAKGSYPPIPYSGNNERNPLVDLVVDYGDLLDVDGVIITHNHNDHFDKVAKAALPKGMPLLCQKEDRETFRGLGFSDMTCPDSHGEWLGFDCRRIVGYHGGHLLRNKLGKSSAFYLKGKESDIYITGDTLLISRIKRSLKRISPDNIIVYAGGARMKILGKVTMDGGDIRKISKLCPSSRIIATHLNGINHCYEKRDLLRRSLGSGYGNVLIPEDGERVF